MCRAPTIVLVVCAALAATSCGGGSDAEDTGDPGELQFELAERNESGARDVRAVLTYESRDRTTIRVDGLDEGSPAGGGPNPVRLRLGSCDEPGEVIEPLEDLQGAESVTSVGLGLPALIQGDYALEVGIPGGGTEAAACGDVPDEAPD